MNLENTVRIAELEAELARLREADAQEGSRRLAELSKIIEDAMKEGQALAKSMGATWTITHENGDIYFQGSWDSWDVDNWMSSSYAC